MSSINVKEIGSFYVAGICEKRENVNPSVHGERIVPIPLRKSSGGYFVHGQMYVHYVKLEKTLARYPLLLWHGGGLTGVCWESTPDGREGWQMYFLRQGHDVYISDAVERGRASWAYCDEMYPNPPIFIHLEHVWKSFRIGPSFDIDPRKRIQWPETQFPVSCLVEFLKQNVPRWAGTFSLAQQAYIDYLLKMKESVVIAHSQGAYMVLEALLKAPGTVKGLIMLEPSALYWPKLDYKNIKALAKIPQLMVFGDYIETSEVWLNYIELLRGYSRAIQDAGGFVDWIHLPDRNIRGNSHMLMMDKNNMEIAEIVQKWMGGKGLIMPS